MKIFLFLFLVLLAVTYKLSSDNGQELTEAHAPEGEIEYEVKKIDLKTITLKPSQNSATSTTPSDISIENNDETQDPVPNFEEGFYSENYGESDRNLVESKYGGDTESKNISEPQLDRGDFIRSQYERTNRKKRDNYGK